MDKQNVQLLWNNLGLVMSKLPAPGILMVCGNKASRENVITLGWMTFGVSWNEPIVTTFVRKSRFSYELLLQNPEFTLNIMPDTFNEAIKICGSKSGRYTDKFQETGLRKNSSSLSSVSTLKDAILTMECKIVSATSLDQPRFSDLLNAKFYKDGDYHELFTAVIKNFNINLQGK